MLVLVAALTAGRPSAARACSCVGDAPLEQSVASADGAFVGRLVRIDRPGILGLLGWNTDADHRFEVEAVAKGRIGRTVIVEAGTEEAACGLGASVGERMALFVSPAGEGRWQGGLCGALADPDELAALSSPPDADAPGAPPPGASNARLLVRAALAASIVGVARVTSSRARTRRDPASP